MNEQRLLLAAALRHAADHLERTDLIEAPVQPETVSAYIPFQDYLMQLVEELDTNDGNLARATDELLGRKVLSLRAGEFTEGEYVEWLRRQIKTAEQNVESRRQAA